MSEWQPIEDEMDEHGGDVLDEEMLASWPNCPTPDCEFKQCLWSGTVYCFKCAERLLGAEELERRYADTHPPETSR